MTLAAVIIGVFWQFRRRTWVVRYVRLMTSIAIGLIHIANTLPPVVSKIHQHNLKILAKLKEHDQENNR